MVAPQKENKIPSFNKSTDKIDNFNHQKSITKDQSFLKHSNKLMEPTLAHNRHPLNTTIGTRTNSPIIARPSTSTNNQGRKSINTGLSPKVTSSNRTNPVQQSSINDSNSRISIINTSTRLHPIRQYPQTLRPQDPSKPSHSQISQPIQRTPSQHKLQPVSHYPQDFNFNPLVPEQSTTPNNIISHKVRDASPNMYSDHDSHPHVSQRTMREIMMDNQKIIELIREYRISGSDYLKNNQTSNSGVIDTM